MKEIAMEERNLEQEIKAGHIDLRQNIFGRIEADQVRIQEGGAAIISAKNDISVTNGGAVAMLAGGNVNISSGGAQLMAAGGDMHIEEGGGMILVSRQARVNKGVIGFLLAREAVIGEDSRVIFNTPQAIALGAALGAVFATLNFLLRRKAR
jgi:hypothetical protein